MIGACLTGSSCYSASGVIEQLDDINVFLAHAVNSTDAMDISFKPAPLRSAQNWSLEGSILTTPKGQNIDLSDISDCHFSDVPVKRYWVATLTLATASDKVVINCNDSKNGVQRQYYYAFVFEVLNALQIHNPTLAIKRGPSRALNIAFACIAVIPIGGAIKFFLDALGGGTGVGLAIGFCVFFLLMGAFIIWCASPWQKTPKDTPAGLIQWLRSWLSGLGTSVSLPANTEQR